MQTQLQADHKALRRNKGCLVDACPGLEERMTVMGRPASPADSLPMTDVIPQVMIVPYLNVSFAENEQVNGQRPQYMYRRPQERYDASPL